MTYHYLLVRPRINPKPTLPTSGRPISIGMKGSRLLLWMRFGMAVVLAILPLCPVAIVVVEFRLFVRDERTG